jgi:hypothetical protein
VVDGQRNQRTPGGLSRTTRRAFALDPGTTQERGPNPVAQWRWRFGRQRGRGRCRLRKEYGYTASQRPGAGPNPGGGTDWAELIANIHGGRELHDSICALAAKLVRSGMTDAAAVNFIRGVMESGAAPKDARWRERWLDVPRAVWSARKKFDPPPVAPFITIKVSDWADKPVPERRWVVRERILRGNTAILSGDGGVGKTTIASQLAVSVEQGFAWLNAVVEEKGPVLFFSAEEDEQEMWRAQA